MRKFISFVLICLLILTVIRLATSRTVEIASWEDLRDVQQSSVEVRLVEVPWGIVSNGIIPYPTLLPYFVFQQRRSPSEPWEEIVRQKPSQTVEAQLDRLALTDVVRFYSAGNIEIRFDRTVAVTQDDGAIWKIHKLEVPHWRQREVDVDTFLLLVVALLQRDQSLFST